MRTLTVLLLSSFIGHHARALESQCFPNTAEAKSWPVCIIYLHGLHPANDKGSYTIYERQNRPLLSKALTADLTKRHCRLAAPVAPAHRSSRGVYLDWQKSSLANVEASAKNACGEKNVELAHPRVLLGFSAGGWEAYNLSKGNCKAIADYSQIIGIGLPELGSDAVDRSGRIVGGCRNVKISRVHNFLTEFPKVLTDITENLPPVPRTKMVETLQGQSTR